MARPKAKPENEKTERINFYISAPMKRALEEEAAKRDVSMAAFIRSLMRDALQR